MLSPGPRELRPPHTRVESYSDAVFAIVVTIMVFEIRIPDALAFAGSADDLQVLALFVVTYVLSFVVVCILWGNHHYLLFTLPDADRKTLWLNNHVLFWVTMVPVVARFFGMHPNAPRAVAAYAFVVMMCTFSLSLLRAYASRVSREHSHRAIHRHVFRKAWIAIAFYAAAIPLAFVSVPVAWVLLLVLPAMFFLPVTHLDDHNEIAG